MIDMTSQILRNPKGAIARCVDDTSRSMIATLAALNFGMLAVYGAIVGLQGSAVQAGMSAIKLPILFILTMAICFPAMHVLSLLLGGKHTLKQLISLFLVALTGTSVIMLGFAPITLFFLVTSGEYEFYILLNTAIVAVSAVFGMRLLARGMEYLASQEESNGVAARKQLFKVWLVLYAFVGCQLCWTMRPFVGDPKQPTVTFRKDKTNFYSNLGRLIVKQFR